MSPISKEEIEREHRRRRSGASHYEWPPELECLHCGQSFNPAKGGSKEGPLCDYCLHRGD